jgi:hypothetical protein
MEAASDLKRWAFGLIVRDPAICFQVKCREKWFCILSSSGTSTGTSHLKYSIDTISESHGLLLEPDQLIGLWFEIVDGIPESTRSVNLPANFGNASEARDGDATGI